MAGTNWDSFYNTVFGGSVGTVQGASLFTSGATGDGSASVATTSGTPSWQETLANDASMLQGQHSQPINTGAFNQILNSIIPGAGNTPGVSTTADPSGTGAQTTGILGDVDFGNIVMRGTIIILGFIFVAVGLSLFGVPAVQQIKKAGKVYGL